MLKTTWHLFCFSMIPLCRLISTILSTVLNPIFCISNGHLALNESCLRLYTSVIMWLIHVIIIKRSHMHQNDCCYINRKKSWRVYYNVYLDSTYGVDLWCRTDYQNRLRYPKLIQECLCLSAAYHFINVFMLELVSLIWILWCTL